MSSSNGCWSVRCYTVRIYDELRCNAAVSWWFRHCWVGTRGRRVAGDVGLRLLDSLYEQMMIDDEWAVRRERGFTWWAYRLAQNVEVGPPVWSEDRYICSVRIWTDVVRNVDFATDPAAVLAAINPFATLSALVWDPADETITECCTAVVHDEIFTWLSKVLATAAVLQNTAAHSRAHSLAEVTGGVPAASDHPLAGQRPEMDDLLNLPEQVVAPEGANPSQFIGAHFGGVESFLRQMRFVGSADSDGCSCEVPFTGWTPSVALPEGGQLETSLVQVFTDAPHPEAGNGLLCLMQTPFTADPDDVAAAANRLNLLESGGDTGTLLLGAWCPDPSSETTLAFCSFIPNVLSKWIFVGNLLSYMASHSRFAGETLSSSAVERQPDREPVGRGRSPLSVSAPQNSRVPLDTPTGAEVREQLRELAKSTAQASSRIAVSAAKLGLAKLRKRLAENKEEE